MSWINVAKDWVWLASALSPFVAGAVVLWLKAQFATKGEHQEGLATVSKGLQEVRGDTDQRLTRLEAATESLPTRLDFEKIGTRLAAVERGTAVTTEAVRGTERLLGKMDHTLNLLLQNKINEERR